MDISEYFKGLISNQQFSENLNQQHYNFAHQLMPYVVENNFPDLLNRVINESAQNWLLQIWNKYSDLEIPSYTALVHPICSSINHSEDIGLIYITMPAPRVSPEVAYIAIVFKIDNDSPSDWLRSYFTLELGLTTSAYWTLGEWNKSNHINLGEFMYEPTLNNFLVTVMTEFKRRWS
ncbi:MAG: hypothetical protein RLZZ507_19 [Cyanobacteriota bacterium]|jgi:hypothetical protein